MNKKKLIGAAGVAAVSLVVLGGGGALACKTTDLNCHLHSPPDFTLDEAKGQRGGSAWITPELSETRVVGGREFPTDFAFLPRGQIAMATRAGLVQVVDQGRVLPKPMLDLRGQVSTWMLRGLMAVAVDATPGGPTRLFVGYSIVDPKHPGVNSAQPTTVRFARYDVVDDVADPASEKVILGSVTGGSCPRLPATADCVPADRDHIGADIEIAKDGTLFLSTGDGGPALANSSRAQNVDSLGGKILHVDQSGRGLAANPFWNGDAAANRSKVWAYGLRNPFRMSLDEDGGMIVGDVGYNHVDELDAVDRGGDYGWPCFEGTVRTPEYRSSAFCVAYYRRHPAPPRKPWFALPHPRWPTVIAGTSLSNASKLPASFRRQYVFADWEKSKMWVTAPPAHGETLVSPKRLELIETGAGGPVRVRVGEDGALYELEVNTGELWRITARPH